MTALGVLSDQEIARRIALRIRSLRIAAALTQAEVARRSGINRPNIARLEHAHARHVPRVDTVVRIAAALGVQPSAILNSLDEP